MKHLLNVISISSFYYKQNQHSYQRNSTAFLGSSQFWIFRRASRTLDKIESLIPHPCLCHHTHILPSSQVTCGNKNIAPQKYSFEYTLYTPV